MCGVGSTTELAGNICRIVVSDVAMILTGLFGSYSSGKAQWVRSAKCSLMLCCRWTLLLISLPCSKLHARVSLRCS